MAETRHMHQRMNQRGITQRMIEIVDQFAVDQDDKRVLDKTNLDRLIKHMDKLRADFIRLRDKGGLVVVECEGAEITAYRLDSYKRNFH